jgi:NADH dehydrogenase (ubiquinone) 1 alpha subcomplex subunit 5
VHPNPRPALIDLYHKTLSAATSLPDVSVYKSAVVSLTQKRLAVVEKTEDLNEIETTIGAGQIEEVIEQAESELGLLEQLKAWRPWEALEEPAPKGQWTGFNK